MACIINQTEPRQPSGTLSCSKFVHHQSTPYARNLAGCVTLQEALQKEVGMLTSLNHPNLVRFCGVCLDPPLLVMEYYRHGSVFGLLDRARRQLAKCRAAAQQAGANQKVGIVRAF